MPGPDLETIRRGLLEIAANLRWTWNGESESLFRPVDPDLWRRVDHNPVAFLADLDDARLAERAADPAYVTALASARGSLRTYVESRTHWGARHAPALVPRPVAYFSAEFALHESLPIYSGGLGVLAGDHLKSCSDLGVPIWGVTILYRQGYFTQRLDAAGNQQEHYRDIDVSKVPLHPARDTRGERLWIELDTALGSFPIDLWIAEVGRARLLLLDGSRDPAAAHRDVFSSRLYGGDQRTRLLQELILGVGGYRALLSLGVRPGVLHLNEGHSAFALLEAIAQAMEDEGLTFHAAAERVRERAVFTTHTPVAAGHDYFPAPLVEEHLAPLIARLRLSRDEFLGLGRVRPHDTGESFGMTVLALRLARRANAVSALHGQTSRRIWSPLWPGRPPQEVPIGHVSNGVHAPTWMAPEMAALCRRRLAEDWPQRTSHADLWERLEGIDPAELWEAKGAMRRRLAPVVGDPGPLTIGVARRIAEYKRAALLLTDPDRLARLLGDPARPIRILFAGKAHPQDEPGKGVLRTLAAAAAEPRFAGKILLLPNHDLSLARALVQGCDLWLNAPRRPLEACGTSGQKAAFNATLNLSILDGWWAEAWDGGNGFAFGEGLTHSDTQLQDRRDATDLYDVLEEQVIPEFFDRDPAGVPRRWVGRIQRAFVTLAWRYNSDRMAIDYASRCYLPAAGTLPCDLTPPA
ncbi:MAG: alpha-glucan family phosphorylase [Candidatus Polarisedimenticolia bacterium]